MVARQVSPAIVVLLEFVQVENAQREPRVPTIGALHLAAELFEEVSLIEQSREVVGDCQLFQLAFQLNPLGHICQDDQKPDK